MLRRRRSLPVARGASPLTLVISPEDFAAYVDLPVEDVDARRLALLEREALALIEGYAPGATAEGSPQVEVIALRMVARAWGSTNGGVVGATQHSMSAGPFSQSLSFGDGGSGALFLSKADRALLDSIFGRKGGAYGVSLIPADADGRGVSSRPWDEWVWRPYE